MSSPTTVVLQDLIRWGMLAVLLGGLLMMFLGGARQRWRRRSQRKKRRQCVQCGLWENAEGDTFKFGTCEMCGGVTTRGRSRKLG